MFSVTTKPLIHNVVSGYNATVFAYGATGAGKTYTMLGNDRKLGIMGLTLNDLFAEMELTKEEVKYKVTMSYLEVLFLLLLPIFLKLKTKCLHLSCVTSISLFYRRFIMK